MLKLPGLKPIPKSDILYLAGDGPYTKVYLINGQVKISSLTLKRSHQRAPEFIRIHKCHLVNPTYIKSFERPTKQFVGVLTLHNEATLGISRRRWDEVSSLLLQRPQG